MSIDCLKILFPEKDEVIRVSRSKVGLDELQLILSWFKKMKTSFESIFRCITSNNNDEAITHCESAVLFIIFIKFFKLVYEKNFTKNLAVAEYVLNTSGLKDIIFPKDNVTDDEKKSKFEKFKENSRKIAEKIKNQVKAKYLKIKFKNAINSLCKCTIKCVADVKKIPTSTTKALDKCRELEDTDEFFLVIGKELTKILGTIKTGTNVLELGVCLEDFYKNEIKGGIFSSTEEIPKLKKCVQYVEDKYKGRILRLEDDCKNIEKFVSEF